ncbi:GNAT family N-acetyltransferase [Streptomyces cavernicola]|uniref:GNAT family N-acetyltransferase n=1 Tax=Streptomyces cavernicola TaxID=3043613 RepID=A0ABT6SLG1_9ACTN|nr:GNAT family N-acetyltransferase [Streptomyces sp. B-S-A6]MDI3409036.1 GNAT family N-acetyltransferase [Streptomyces sp. B-S-A6]
MPTWTIEAEPVTGPEIGDVMWQYFTEIAQRVMGRPAAEAELRRALARDPHDDLAPPSGVFLVARGQDGDLLGCAGVRLLPRAPATAELKRMFVRPAGRGTGLGRGLLVAAETAAQGLGATRMVCETNTQLTEARALYEAHAYEEIPPYEGLGRADHWFAKALVRGNADK